ncbi:hypothetical protein VitviT2T_007937 [Vitis vinifera]|uniref:Uncharacterized protein n=1 Tax=Vitis vinifera TaxID=29760 RepID=A0ABY9C1K7_VITVI|nr:hypothetical protein VitviT2T_007937 [Vitis vinifera]
MRFLALALALMMVSSCMAANMKTFMVGMQERQLVETSYEEDKGVNNHHTIPRQDFNNYGGSGSKGGGGDGDGGKKN